MANGQNAYNLTQGLTAGVDGFFQGKQIAMQEDEYERRRRMDEERMRRQQGLDQQANEEYQYQKGLRPMQEQAMQSGLTAQKQSAQMQQMQLEEKMREMEREGVVEAMQLLDAGLPNEAAQAFNAAPEGRRKTRGFRPHPAKPGVWIGSDEQGQEGEIDPKMILKAYGKWKQQTPIELNYGSKLVDPSGRVIVDNPRIDGGEGGMKPGVYKTRDGVPIKHEQLVAQYKIENNFPDDFELMMLDPAPKAAALERIAKAKPFAEWAAERGVVGVPAVAQQGGGDEMEVLPPPQAAAGRTIQDDQGRVFKSDGQWWYDQEGNPVDASGNPINMRRGMTGQGASGKW